MFYKFKFIFYKIKNKMMIKKGDVNGYICFKRMTKMMIKKRDVNGYISSIFYLHLFCNFGFFSNLNKAHNNSLVLKMIEVSL